MLSNDIINIVRFFTFFFLIFFTSCYNYLELFSEIESLLVFSMFH